MPRAIWTGAVTFGLVSVPVRLVPAVRSKEVRFHMLHDEDGGRIQQKRVCALDGEEVPYEHVVKGYEIARDKHVVVTKEELSAFDPEATHTLDIEDFVELGEIDPIYFGSTYYLVPDRGGARPYALLLEAMKRTGKVAVGRIVLRTKQHLCVVRPVGRVLGVSMMQYADEIVSEADLEGLPSDRIKPTARELELADKLVESLATAFQPDKYKDNYRERVLELLERKAAGEQIVTAPSAPAKTTKAADLFEALQASLRVGKGDRAEPPAKARPKKRRAA